MRTRVAYLAVKEVMEQWFGSEIAFLKVMGQYRKDSQDPRASFKNSRRSIGDYFRWRQKRSEATINRIEKYIKLSVLRVLDFGCGYGGLTASLVEKGARVTAVDVDPGVIKIAKGFLQGKQGCKIVKVDDKALPFTDGSFDVIFLFDVIEHVKNPGQVISECGRVLKDGGILYVEFTPYYSFIGHHLWDVTYLPIHLLPKSLIRKIIFSKSPWRSFENKNELWGNFLSLNKVKINELQRLVSSFSKIEERFVIKWPDVFEINLPLLNFLGPLKDTFTMSFEAIYKKKN